MSNDENASHRCTGRTAAGGRCRRRAEEGATRCSQHGYKMPGRPSRLTPELTEAIVYLVLEGNYLETAAQANGVAPSTLHYWRRRGQDAWARAEEAVEDRNELLGDGIYDRTDPAEWVYLDFLDALKTAEAYAETELLRRASAGGFGWQAPMTVLERRHPARWKRREARELEGADGGAIPVRVVTPDTDGKRRELVGIIAELGVLEDLEPAAAPATESTTKTGRKTGQKRGGK